MSERKRQMKMMKLACLPNLYIVIPRRIERTPKMPNYSLIVMLLSEDILIVQDIFVSREQWHYYINYTNCSNLTEALSKFQKYSLTASFEFFKLFHLEWNPGWANRIAIKKRFSLRTEMYTWYRALCNIKYIGYLNSPTGHVLNMFLNFKKFEPQRSWFNI